MADKISKKELVQFALTVAEQLPKITSNPIIKAVADKAGLSDMISKLNNMSKDDFKSGASEVFQGAIPPDRVINHDSDLRYVLDNIKFRNTVLDFKWRYEIAPHYGVYDDHGIDMPTQDGWEISASFERPDTHTGRAGRGVGRPLFIARGATETAVFFSVIVLLELLIKHEMMEGIEFLRSDGKYVRPLYPHTSVHALMSLQTPDQTFVD